ncbi:MAG: hypothetical protein AAGM45_15905 [Cyanobacteria bacterium J06588_5]
MAEIQLLILLEVRQGDGGVRGSVRLISWYPIFVDCGGSPAIALVRDL